MKCLVSRSSSQIIYRDSCKESNKSFAIIRLMLVIAIFTALVAVLVPKISAFFAKGQIFAANKEVTNVELAAQAYWADNNRQWPPNDCNTDLIPDYINKTAVHHNYEFNTDGLVIVPDGKISEVNANIRWNEDQHIWVKD